MAVNNSLSKQNSSSNTIKGYINKYQGEIAKALPKVMTPERFTRIATSAVSNNPKLAECTPVSFISAVMNAAQLGLEPNTPLGHAYLIPYGSQCQFQIGYAGMLALANRAGTRVDAHVVYENDEFSFSYGLNPELIHKPTLTKRGKPIAYYATWKNKENFGFTVMSQEDVEAHAKKYSKTVNNGPWKTDFEAMAKKTVIKQALKYAPLSSEFAMQLATDETVKSKIDVDMTLVPEDTLEADYEIKEAKANEEPVLL